jgi:hypothetical protein
VRFHQYLIYKDNNGWFSSGVGKVLYVIDSVGNSIVKLLKPYLRVRILM